MGFRAGRKASDRYPYKKKAEGDLRVIHTEEKASKDRIRDWSDDAISQRTPGATRS